MLSLAVLPFEAGAQERFAFEPVDEAVSEPALYASRAALLEALRRRDKIALDRWLFDSLNGSGTERAIILARLAIGAEAAESLADLLTHGGKFVDQARTEFCAPYWSRWPELASLPPHLAFEGLPWVVIVPDAVVRSAPRADGRELGRLSLELVQVLPAEQADAAGQFVAVTYRGNRGYVLRSDVREIEGAGKACFRARGDGWYLATFK
ncbi:MAG TPA: hypothetical protein PLH72_07540 [Vicinamibacterales bacterium]|nr:hypothetical protein [Vicinamibacterales bacterium]